MYPYFKHFTLMESGYRASQGCGKISPMPTTELFSMFGSDYALMEALTVFKGCRAGVFVMVTSINRKSWCLLAPKCYIVLMCVCTKIFALPLR